MAFSATIASRAALAEGIHCAWRRIASMQSGAGREQPQVGALVCVMLFRFEQGVVDAVATSLMARAVLMGSVMRPLRREFLPCNVSGELGPRWYLCAARVVINSPALRRTACRKRAWVLPRGQQEFFFGSTFSHAHTETGRCSREPARIMQ